MEISSKTLSQIKDLKILGISAGVVLGIASVVSYLYFVHYQNELARLNIKKLNSEGFDEDRIVDKAFDQF